MNTDIGNMHWPDSGNITVPIQILLSRKATIPAAVAAGMLQGAAVCSEEPKAPEDGFAGRVGKPQAVNTAEAVRKAESKSVTFGSEAYKGHSLARLERNYRVGELAVIERSAVTDC